MKVWVYLSKGWGVKAVFHSLNSRPWRFFCLSFKNVVTISKQLSGKYWCESMISTFLNSHFLLIDVFLGISRLISGVAPGIQNLKFYLQGEHNFTILVFFVWQGVNRVNWLYSNHETIVFSPEENTKILVISKFQSVLTF